MISPAPFHQTLDSESVPVVPLLRSTIVLATPHVGSHTAVLAPCPVTHCAV